MSSSPVANRGISSGAPVSTSPLRQRVEEIEDQALALVSTLQGDAEMAMAGAADREVMKIFSSVSVWRVVAFLTAVPGSPRQTAPTVGTQPPIGGAARRRRNAVGRFACSWDRLACR